MAGKYDHQTIEPKWQKQWDKEKVFVVKNNISDPHKYVLDMFPYPSGDGLHVGHPEGYTATDIFSRYLRMQGESVLHPMGWDAFGLPAENYAIKKGVHPREVTEKNIANFKRQIQSLGLSYDWDREINTTDPKYYKWTQWIFLQLFKKGLAYEKEAPIWWCPKDKTGLSNEEVVNGKCDRCGSTVEKKMLKQWMLKITAYADRLLAGLDKLDWPEGIKALQRNWIGKSEGATIHFLLTFKKNQAANDHRGPNGERAQLSVFTTRPDTIFGATYLVLSPEHPWITLAIDDAHDVLANKPAVKKYVQQAQKKSDIERMTDQKEKTGVELKGVVAINPANGQEIPMFVADYVLSGYGTGAIMAVPGHDERDHAFAIKYKLPILTVVEPVTGEPRPDEEPRKSIVAIVQHPKTKKILSINWGPKNGGNLFIGGGREENEDPVTCAIREIKEETGYTEVKLIEQSEIIHHHYFAHSKNVARNIEAIGMYFTLDNEERSQPEVEADEQGKFTVEWLTQDEAEQKVTDPLHGYLFQKFIRGKCFVGEGIMTNGPLRPTSPISPSPMESPAVSPGAYGHLGNELEVTGYAGPYEGLSSEEFSQRIIGWLEQQGKGHKATSYKLRDWVFSRQRYWGEPIPLVHCEHCKEVVESTPHHLELVSAAEWQAWVDGVQTIENAALAQDVSSDTKHANHYVKVTLGANVGYWRVREVKKNSLTLKHVLPGIILVPEKELPLELPNVEKYEPTGTGESPLAGINKWVDVKCRICGHPAKRETNTMPQWAGSCWYYLRFCDPQNDAAFASAEAMKAWLPVDMYVGGAEHAVLHLLYARFWHLVLFDIGAIPKENNAGQSLEEPFQKLKNQGLILGPDGEKMSKSRGNVINPDEIVEKYGADTLRMYEMFMGPFEDAKPWDTNGILGVRRFLDKVYRASERITDGVADKRMHKYIYSISDGIVNFRFNTCVSDLMKWVNEFGNEEVSKEEFSIFLKVLSPFAPHLAEELWSDLGNKEFITTTEWPKFDASKVKSESVTIAIQVNGKHRANVTVPTGSNESVVREAAELDANVKKFLDREPKKVIYVRDRLINFVI